MHAEAVLSVDDLDRLVRDLIPLHVDLGEKRGISLGAPHRVELVPDMGLRIKGDARVEWEALGVSIPVSLRAWQALLTPSVALRDGDHVLAFDAHLEELDLKGVPSLVEGGITQVINETIKTQTAKMVWNFTRGLAWRTSLGSSVSPKKDFEIHPVSGSVQVTASELRAVVYFACSFPIRDVTPKRSVPPSTTS